mgnify:CR=1 FL=1
MRIFPLLFPILPIRAAQALLNSSGTLSDTYDFTKLREHDGKYTWLSVEANNLGYRLQKEGYGTEYD